MHFPQRLSELVTISQRTSIALGALLICTSTACTQWGQVKSNGQTSEVSRRMVGAPQVAHSSSSNHSASLAGVFSRGSRTSVGGAGLSASSGKMDRTHCIQQAEISYQRPFTLESVPTRRGLDLAGGLTLIGVGLISLLIVQDNSTTIFSPGDPLYKEPADPTAGYLLSGALIGGGVGWLWHSYRALPKSPKPPTTSGMDNWKEMKFVEASGCGLVPGDSPQPSNDAPSAELTGDIEAKLKQLKKLRAADLISEEEYQEKRRILVNQL
ncbi:MAG: SHOCT domain-containing protein [Kofleriaceae bacterium]|nr:SHOCT domain-containing protein [Kofleriaceae bacterium]